MKKDWLQKLSPRRQKQLLAGMLVGLLLLLLPSVWDVGTRRKYQTPAQENLDLKQETEAYKQELTEELTALLAQVEGVGEVRLLITFANSVEYEYLKEENENVDAGAQDRRRDYSENYLFVEDRSGGRRVLAVKRLLPQVQGAAVVCDGGGDDAVRKQVMELLRASLHISAANISVSPLAS